MNRPFTKIQPKRAKSLDPYKTIPIPPKSVVRLAHSDRNTPEWRSEKGNTFRIGYYGLKDGLDCIWLVNDLGEYEQTTDHKFLFKYYDILMVSDERSLFGNRRPKIPPVRKAEALQKATKHRKRRD